MKRFITRPYSKIDRCILNVLISLLSIHFSWWIVGQFKDMANDYWWIYLSTSIAFSVVIAYPIAYLYWILYSPIAVNIRLSKKVSAYLFDRYKPQLIRNFFDIPKACKLIDEICNAIIVPIEQRKVLYDQMCRIWTECGGSSIYKVYIVPGFITEKWKRAVVEYRKYEIEND